MIVRLAVEAEADLEGIGDYIARDDPRRAMKFIREMREQCSALSDFPERCPLVPRYEHRGVRRQIYGRYLIFYRVGGNEIVILQILHGAQDYAAILFPD